MSPRVDGLPNVRGIPTLTHVPCRSSTSRIVPAGTTVSATLGASARQMVDLSRVTRTESAEATTADAAQTRTTSTAKRLAARKHGLSDLCDHGEIGIDHVGYLVFECLAHQ